LVGVAVIHESIADELSNDVDVECAAMIEVSQVSRLEGVLCPIVEDTKADSRVGATTNTGGICCGSLSSSSNAAPWRGGRRRKIGRDSERSVESIRLCPSSFSLAVRVLLALRARGERRGRCLAIVFQLVTRCLRNDVNIESRIMVDASLVLGLEGIFCGLSSVESRAKFDCWIAAASKIEC